MSKTRPTTTANNNEAQTMTGTITITGGNSAASSTLPTRAALAGARAQALAGRVARRSLGEGGRGGGRAVPVAKSRRAGLLGGTSSLALATASVIVALGVSLPEGARAQVAQCTLTGADQNCYNAVSLSAGGYGIKDTGTLTVTNQANGSIYGFIFGRSFGITAANAIVTGNDGVIRATGTLAGGGVSGGIAIRAMSTMDAAGNLTGGNVTITNGTGTAGGAVGIIEATRYWRHCHQGRRHRHGEQQSGRAGSPAMPMPSMPRLSISPMTA